MKYCTKCGQELEDNAVYCTGCGAQNNGQTTTVEDKKSVGFNILSFFFPIVGLILFLVWKKDTPIKAKGCGISALIGFVVGIILSFCQIILLGSALEGLM